jgi:hypothetical protein
MIPALPDTLGQSPHDRFKKFAKALLAVPKTEIMPVEEALAKLESDKRKIDANIVDVRREMVKRKIKTKPSSRP